MNFMEWLRQPWPWYIAGPLIGLMVPLLLVLGNKTFGVSSSLRHICAACMPSRIPFFSYDWKKEAWNLFFVAGIVVGAFVAFHFFQNPDPVNVSPALVADLKQYGITNYNGLVPPELFNWSSLFTVKGLILTVGGGFMVGFGTRYAGGCTSGHSIMGLSNLQFPSLVATICFMIGGFIVANWVLPFILQL
ncbi:MAG TPA: YeeE/YedE thiosulfate transporter family protein [Chitinophagaceae bacterium]